MSIYRRHAKRPPAETQYPIGFVECLECNGQFRTLYRHLASHGLTAVGYRSKYPGAPTACEEVHRRQRQGGVEANRVKRLYPERVRRSVRRGGTPPDGGAPDTTTTSHGQGAQ